MNKRGTFMSNRTANIIVIIYLALAGIITLNFLSHSIPTHSTGIAFLIAAVYGIVAVHKNLPFFA